MSYTQTADGGTRVGGPSRRQLDTTVEQPQNAPVEAATFPGVVSKAGRVGPRKNPTLPATYMIRPPRPFVLSGYDAGAA